MVMLMESTIFFLISTIFAKHFYLVKTEERPVLFRDGRKLSLSPAPSSSLAWFSVAHWNPLDTDYEPNDVEIIPNNQKTLATEFFNASVLTFVDSNEKEMQRLAREIDEMLEQEMAGLEGGSQDL